MINNFQKFRFTFVEGEFYFFQIIKRKKDNPTTPGINGNNHARCIKEYSIHNQEELEKRMQEMIDITNATNSRIYVHPSRRSEEQVRKQMALMMGEHIALGKHRLSGMYRSACGEVISENKLWIVDADGLDTNVDEMANDILKIRPFKDIYQILPTKNGFHIISHPFDLSEFRKKYPKVDVHKNNPTLIYAP